MLKALVVDDDEINREFLNDALALFDWSCDFAEDGEKALIAFKNSLIENTPYHLVILDIKLPCINGKLVLKIIRIFEELKAVEKNVIILMSSGYSEENFSQDSLLEQCNGFLQKPYNLDILKNKLTKLGFII